MKKNIEDTPMSIFSPRSSRSRRSFMSLRSGRRQGQAIVLIALVMVAVLAFVALAIDGGELYLTRRKAQNAADGAVIAAVYELCKDPSQPDVTANPPAYPTSRTEDAIAAAIAAAADNGFTIAESDVTFPDAPGDYNHILVTVTTTKEARLIQVVYKGPLVVSAAAEGTCKPATKHVTGMAMVGLGACSGGGGAHGIAYSGSDVTITGGFSTNGDASFSGSAGHQTTISACPSGVTTGPCTTSPAGSTVDGTDPAISNSKVAYSPLDPVTSPAETKFPAFWSISEFQAGGPVYTVAQELGVYHAASGNISSWSGFPGINSNGSNLTPGIYYVPGNVSLNASDMKNAKLSGVTLVATGTISIGLTGSDTNVWTMYQFPKLYPNDTAAHQQGEEVGMGPMPVIYADGGPNACTNSAAYGVNSSGRFNFMGVIYSPKGKCSFSFNSGGSADGALICMQVDVSGSTYTINYNPALLPPWDPNGGIAH
jgi:Flp pilus assembly protein TadG